MFEENLKKFKDAINEELKKILLKLNNENCIFLGDAMEYSLISGGKLLRPVLTLAVCEMFGGDFKKALPFACAVEFMHVGSLVHDDLPCMDDDEKRRGKASCHVKYDEATAVLVGDAFFCSAFEILTYARECGLNNEKILDAVFLLSRMFGTKGTIAGQDMDIFIDVKKNKENYIEKIAEYKTSCLIKAACSLGAIAAGAEKTKIELICEYGQYLGLFFQICDDILDFEKEKNKNSGKLNFVVVYGLTQAQKKAEQYYSKALMILKGLQKNEFLQEFTRLVFNRIS